MCSWLDIAREQRGTPISSLMVRTADGLMVENVNARLFQNATAVVSLLTSGTRSERSMSESLVRLGTRPVHG
jgi:hypothetical protein